MSFQDPGNNGSQGGGLFGALGNLFSGLGQSQPSPQPQQTMTGRGMVTPQTMGPNAPLFLQDSAAPIPPPSPTPPPAQPPGGMTPPAQSGGFNPTAPVSYSPVAQPPSPVGGLGAFSQGPLGFFNGISMALTGRPSPAYMQAVQAQQKQAEAQRAQEQAQYGALKDQSELATTYGNSAANNQSLADSGISPPTSGLTTDPQKIQLLQEQARLGNPRAYATLSGINKPAADAITDEYQSHWQDARGAINTLMGRVANAKSDPELQAALQMSASDPDLKAAGITDPASFFGGPNATLATAQKALPSLRQQIQVGDNANGQWAAKQQQLNGFSDAPADVKTANQGAFRIGTTDPDLPMKYNPRTGEIGMDIGSAISKGQAIIGDDKVKAMQGQIDADAKTTMGTYGDLDRLQTQLSTSAGMANMNSAAGYQHIVDTLSKIGSGGRATQWNTNLLEANNSLRTRFESEIGTVWNGKPIPPQLMEQYKNVIALAKDSYAQEINARVAPVAQQAGEANVDLSRIIPANLATSNAAIGQAYAAGHATLQQWLGQSQSGLVRIPTRYDANGNAISSTTPNDNLRTHIGKTQAQQQDQPTAPVGPGAFGPPGSPPSGAPPTQPNAPGNPTPPATPSVPAAPRGAAYVAKAADGTPVYVDGSGQAMSKAPPGTPIGRLTAPAPAAPAASAPGSYNATAQLSPNVLDRISGSESGGSYTIRSNWVDPATGKAQPLSEAASGKYQFIGPTWRQYAARIPGAAQYATAADAPPQIQDQAANLLLQDNTNGLKSAGVPVNDATVYSAWAVGPGDAPKLWKADPNAPVTSIGIRPISLRANPGFFYNKDGTPKTVAQAQQAFSTHMAGHTLPASASGAATPRSATPGDPGYAQPPGPGAVMPPLNRGAPGLPPQPAPQQTSALPPLPSLAQPPANGAPPPVTPNPPPQGPPGTAIAPLAVGRAAPVTPGDIAASQANPPPIVPHPVGRANPVGHTPEQEAAAVQARRDALVGGLQTADDFMRAGGSALGADYVAAAASTWGPGATGKSFADNLADEKAKNAAAAARSPTATTVGRIAGQGSAAALGPESILGQAAVGAASSGAAAKSAAPADAAFDALGGAASAGTGAMIGKIAGPYVAKLFGRGGAAADELTSAVKTMDSTDPSNPAHQAALAVGQKYGISRDKMTEIADALEAGATKGQAQAGVPVSTPNRVSQRIAQPVGQAYQEAETGLNAVRDSVPATMVRPTRPPSAQEAMEQAGAGEGSSPAFGMAKQIDRLQTEPGTTADVRFANLATLRSRALANARADTANSPAYQQAADLAREAQGRVLVAAMGGPNGQGALQSLAANSELYAQAVNTLPSDLLGTAARGVADGTAANSSTGNLMLAAARLGAKGNEKAIGMVNNFDQLSAGDPLAKQAFSGAYIQDAISKVNSPQALKVAADRMLTGADKSVADVTLTPQHKLLIQDMSANPSKYTKAWAGAQAAGHDAEEARDMTTLVGLEGIHDLMHGTLTAPVSAIRMGQKIMNWAAARQYGSKATLDDYLPGLRPWLTGSQVGGAVGGAAGDSMARTMQ